MLITLLGFKLHITPSNFILQLSPCNQFFLPIIPIFASQKWAPPMNGKPRQWHYHKTFPLHNALVGHDWTIAFYSAHWGSRNEWSTLLTIHLWNPIWFWKKLFRKFFFQVKWFSVFSLKGWATNKRPGRFSLGQCDMPRYHEEIKHLQWVNSNQCNCIILKYLFVQQ